MTRRASLADEPLPSDVDFEDSAAEIEDRLSSPPQYEIATYPADFTLEVLRSKWDSGELKIPDFQRGFVWSQVQASKLIESFLVGLPVPSIFLYTERGSENLLVVDGQQRLRSVFYYLEGLFGEERRGQRPVFRLKGISEKSPYHDKTFLDLQTENEPASKRLFNSVLRAFIIRQLDPNDDTSVFHIFERLNTGGTLLHNQEVRNAICAGPFNEMLHDLNQLPTWRKILGKPSIDSRMRDVELILRFFALRHALDKYEKPIKDFMSRYMRTHAHDSPGLIQQYREEFTGVTEAVLRALGEKPFHLYAGFNSSAFDSVYCAFSLNVNDIPENIAARYARLSKSEAFEDLVRGGTTDVDQVRNRIRKARRELFE